MSLRACLSPSSHNSIQTCAFPHPGALRKADTSPSVGISQLGNSSHPCQSTGGCSPSHCDWLRNEHMTQFRPMKCQGWLSGEGLLEKIVSQSFKELLERMLLSFWLERYATISSETSVAILPPGEKQGLGCTDTMEKQLREGKKLDCWWQVELLPHMYPIVHPISAFCWYKSLHLIPCAVGAPLSSVLWHSQPQRIQTEKWEISSHPQLFPSTCSYFALPCFQWFCVFFSWKNTTDFQETFHELMSGREQVTWSPCVFSILERVKFDWRVSGLLPAPRANDRFHVADLIMQSFTHSNQRKALFGF